MNVAKDYYAILGVLPSAEDAVVRAAYRALVQKYHPDKSDRSSSGGSNTQILQEINEAYAVLSDPEKKRRYDQARQRHGENFDPDADDRGQSAYDGSDSATLDRWRKAIEYYPDLVEIDADLCRTSYRLAFAFRTTLLESKEFERRHKLARALERKFLELYFGRNEDILKFAKTLIRKNERAAAKELNKAVAVLGDQTNANLIIERIQNRFQLSTNAQHGDYRTQGAGSQQSGAKSVPIATAPLYVPIMFFVSLLVLFVVAANWVGPKGDSDSDRPRASESGAPVPSQQDSSALARCGDAPGSGSVWYPVLIHRGDLKLLRQKYCKDAVQTQSDDGAPAVQLASFSDFERASAFAQKVGGTIGSAYKLTSSPNITSNVETILAGNTASKPRNDTEKDGRLALEPKPYQANSERAQREYVRPSTAPNGQPWPVSSGYIVGYDHLRTEGLSTVTVDNSSNDSDVFVKLVALDNAQALPVRQFYIPAFGKFTVNKISAGNYDVRYRDLSSGRLSRTEAFNLKEIPTYAGMQYSNVTMTLYKVRDGNMRTYGLSEAEF